MEEETREEVTAEAPSGSEPTSAEKIAGLVEAMGSLAKVSEDLVRSTQALAETARAIVERGA